MFIYEATNLFKALVKIFCGTYIFQGHLSFLQSYSSFLLVNAIYIYNIIDYHAYSVFN
jgi:hypothetical protein